MMRRRTGGGPDDAAGGAGIDGSADGSADGLVDSIPRALTRRDSLRKLHHVKNVGMLSSLCLLINAQIGPGIPFTPLLFQEAGWLVPIIAFAVFAVVSSFSVLFLVEAMQALPGNRHFQGTVEYATLINFYFGKWWHVVGQVFLYGALQANAIQSIVLCAQSFDYILLDLFGSNCGIAFDQGPLCVYKHALPPNAAVSPFGDARMCVTGGFLLLIGVASFLGRYNLDETMIVQKITLFLTLMIAFYWIGGSASLPLQPLPVCRTQGLAHITGTIMLNLAYSTVVPSWVNIKTAQVSVQRTVWTATGGAALLYVVMSLLPAMALQITDPSGNVLAAIKASLPPKLLARISIDAFAIGMLAPAIPVNFIVSRHNLVQNGVLAHRWATAACFVVPWLVAMPMLTGSVLQDFVTWSSLIFVGTANFVIPLLIYLKAVRFRRTYNRYRYLTTKQRALLKLIHWTSHRITEYLAANHPAGGSPGGSDLAVLHGGSSADVPMIARAGSYADGGLVRDALAALGDPADPTGDPVHPTGGAIIHGEPILSTDDDDDDDDDDVDDDAYGNDRMSNGFVGSGSDAGPTTPSTAPIPASVMLGPAVLLPSTLALAPAAPAPAPDGGTSPPPLAPTPVPMPTPGTTPTPGTMPVPMPRTHRRPVPPNRTASASAMTVATASMPRPVTVLGETPPMPRMMTAPRPTMRHAPSLVAMPGYSPPGAGMPLDAAGRAPLDPLDVDVDDMMVTLDGELMLRAPTRRRRPSRLVAALTLTRGDSAGSLDPRPSPGDRLAGWRQRLTRAPSPPLSPTRAASDAAALLAPRTPDRRTAAAAVTPAIAAGPTPSRISVTSRVSGRRLSPHPASRGDTAASKSMPPRPAVILAQSDAASELEARPSHGGPVTTITVMEPANDGAALPRADAKVSLDRLPAHLHLPYVERDERSRSWLTPPRVSLATRSITTPASSAQHAASAASSAHASHDAAAAAAAALPWYADGRLAPPSPTAAPTTPDARSRGGSFAAASALSLSSSRSPVFLDEDVPDPEAHLPQSSLERRATAMVRRLERMAARALGRTPSDPRADDAAALRPLPTFHITQATTPPLSLDERRELDLPPVPPAPPAAAAALPFLEDVTAAATTAASPMSPRARRDVLNDSSGTLIAGEDGSAKRDGAAKHHRLAPHVPLAAPSGTLKGANSTSGSDRRVPPAVLTTTTTITDRAGRQVSRHLTSEQLRCRSPSPFSDGGDAEAEAEAKLERHGRRAADAGSGRGRADDASGTAEGIALWARWPSSPGPSASASAVGAAGPRPPSDVYPTDSPTRPSSYAFAVSYGDPSLLGRAKTLPAHPDFHGPAFRALPAWCASVRGATVAVYLLVLTSSINLLNLVLGFF